MRKRNSDLQVSKAYKHVNRQTRLGAETAIGKKIFNRSMPKQPNACIYSNINLKMNKKSIKYALLNKHSYMNVNFTKTHRKTTRTSTSFPTRAHASLYL